MKIRIYLSLCLLFFLANSTQGQTILFVGNSLTYTNDLPKILENIGNDLETTIQTTSLCYPNYAIEDHWNDGKLQTLISSKQFDHVIIQQGPSSQANGKIMLVDYGKKINDYSKTFGAHFGYFMVWPSKRYYHTFDGVINNYTDAASKNQALLYPVGSVWQQLNANNPSINLYSSDGFHPSPTGSFLAALVIYHTLHPDQDILDLEYNNYRKWSNKKSFKSILKMINEL